MEKTSLTKCHPRDCLIALLLCLFPLLAGCADEARSADEAPEEELPEPELTEQWEPVPSQVETAGAVPSDAITLFDGSTLDAWEPVNEEAPSWSIEDGNLVVVPQKPPSNLRSKQSFGDVQLHLEFRTPPVVEEEGQGRGNSGVFLMGLYEIQILDSWDNSTYANGQLGSIYKQYPPLVNPAREPGEWQVYDVVFLAPRFDSKGNVERPARMTAFLNGVLVQYDSELKGPTTYRGPPAYKAHADKLPLVLQDHGDLLAFRNIWIRELDGEEIADRTILDSL